MPSLLSQLVPLYLRATRANSIYLTTAAAERHLERRRQHPTTASPTRRMRRHFDITTDTSRGWPVFTIAPRGTSAGAVVYLHGGAWVNEIAPQHWQLIAEIAAAGTTVIVPIYPLVPFGTAHQVVDAVVGLARQATGPVSLAGDSAGGQIVLSAALELEGQIAATVLIAPALDLAMRNPEMDAVQPHDPWLAKPGTRVFIESWRGDLPLLDPRVSPIEGDLTGLGPLVIFSGTRDILNPDARLLAERARAAGVDVEYHEEAGLVHVYPLTPTPEGRASRKRIVERSPRPTQNKECAMSATSEHSSTASAKTAAGNTNRAALRAGGIAVLIAGLGGIAWFALELLPPVLGFDDTDNPEVSLDYLRQFPQFYPLAGVVLFIMAIAYVVASFAVSDALAPRTSSLARRSLSALGLMSAGFLFMHGVLRESVGPLLYIDGMTSGWGESAYLTLQMLGTHGFAQASLLVLGIWAVGISVAGARSNELPIWLCVLGIVTGLRLVILIAGPFLTAKSFDLPDFLWIGSVALIPLGMLWWLGLGVVLLVKSRLRHEQIPIDSAR